MFQAKAFCIVIGWALVSGAVTQSAGFPDLSLFTQSSTEHEIIPVDQSFSVRSVQGTVFFANHPGEPLTDVLVEILGPGDVKSIRHATTSEKGKFKIGEVPEGTYRFKTTRNGFSSLVGTIVVSRRAKGSTRITLNVPLGT